MKLTTKQIEQIELDYEAHDIELEDFLISGIKDGGTERINLLELDSDFYEVYGDPVETDDREGLIEKCVLIAKKMIKDCEEDFPGVKLEICEYPDWEKLFRSTKATKKQLQKLSKKHFYGDPDFCSRPYYPFLNMDFDYYMDYLIQK